MVRHHDDYSHQRFAHHLDDDSVGCCFLLRPLYVRNYSAHTSALPPVFLAATMTVPGMPLKPMAMLLCYTLGIMGILTPYATGPSPIYYGSGFIKVSEFWKLGFIFGVIFLGTYLLIGIPYLGMVPKVRKRFFLLNDCIETLRPHDGEFFCKTKK